MSKQQFRVINFRPDTLATITKADEIISEYGGQKLTARQVYYQFVSRGLIPNTPRSYQNLTSMLTDARYAGLISWDAIEDRGREADVPSGWDSIDEIVDAAVNQFRLPRWSDQPKYLELWVEKQALAGVLAPIARRNHVPLMVNKGYSSASAMKAAAERMLEAVGVDNVQVSCSGCNAFVDDRTGRKCNACREDCGVEVLAFDGSGGTDFDKEVVVLYLGDHDPSGEDMVRDIRDRLTEFGVPNLTVDKIALTMEQIRRFKPPPNPAKVTDSRAKAYIEKYGDLAERVKAQAAQLGQTKVPELSSCSYCLVAAGGTDDAWMDLPRMSLADAQVHAMTCEHNPLVQRSDSLASELSSVRAHLEINIQAMRSAEVERDDARERLRECQDAIEEMLDGSMTTGEMWRALRELL